MDEDDEDDEDSQTSHLITGCDNKWNPVFPKDRKLAEARGREWETMSMQLKIVMQSYAKGPVLYLNKLKESR